MLKNWLTSSIVSWFGEYVEGINQENLRIAAWAGSIEFESLEIKKKAISKFFPTTVESGNIQRMSISIPWNSLRGSPTQISIDDVTIMLKPECYTDWDQNEVIQQIHQFREETLHKFIEKSNQINSNEGYWSRLAGTVFENLQISIKNLRVVFKDPDALIINQFLTNTPLSQNPYAFTVVLDSFSVSTADSNWQIKFVDRDTRRKQRYGYTHKLIQMIGLRIVQGDVLLDPEAESVQLLEPISATLRLKARDHCIEETKSKEFDISTELLIDQIIFNATPQQLQSLLAFANHFNIVTNAKQHCILKRPQTFVRGNAKEWWKFAYRCVLWDMRESLFNCENGICWIRVKKFGRIRRKYFELWKDLAVAKQDELDGDSDAKEEVEQLQIELSELEDMEHLDLETIVVLRRLADAVIQKEVQALENNPFGLQDSEQLYDDGPDSEESEESDSPDPQTKSSAIGGWVYWALGWDQNNSNENESKKESKEGVKEIKEIKKIDEKKVVSPDIEEIYGAFGVTPEEAMLLYPSAPSIRVELHIQDGKTVLWLEETISTMVGLNQSHTPKVMRLSCAGNVLITFEPTKQCFGFQGSLEHFMIEQQSLQHTSPVSPPSIEQDLQDQVYWQQLFTMKNKNDTDSCDKDQDSSALSLDIRRSILGSDPFDLKAPIHLFVQCKSQPIQLLFHSTAIDFGLEFMCPLLQMLLASQNESISTPKPIFQKHGVLEGNDLVNSNSVQKITRTLSHSTVSRSDSQRSKRTRKKARTREIIPEIHIEIHAPVCYIPRHADSRQSSIQHGQVSSLSENDSILVIDFGHLACHTVERVPVTTNSSTLKRYAPIEELELFWRLSSVQVHVLNGLDTCYESMAVNTDDPPPSCLIAPIDLEIVTRIEESEIICDLERVGSEAGQNRQIRRVHCTGNLKMAVFIVQVRLLEEVAGIFWSWSFGLTRRKEVVTTQDLYSMTQEKPHWRDSHGNATELEKDPDSQRLSDRSEADLDSFPDWLVSFDFSLSHLHLFLHDESGQQLIKLFIQGLHGSWHMRLEKPPLILVQMNDEKSQKSARESILQAQNWEYLLVNTDFDIRISLLHHVLLSIQSIHIEDRLQYAGKDFCVLATSNPSQDCHLVKYLALRKTDPIDSNDNNTNEESRTLTRFSITACKGYGTVVDFYFNILRLQWNPSTIIHITKMLNSLDFGPKNDYCHESHQTWRGEDQPLALSLVVRQYGETLTTSAADMASSLLLGVDKTKENIESTEEKEDSMSVQSLRYPVCLRFQLKGFSIAFNKPGMKRQVMELAVTNFTVLTTTFNAFNDICVEGKLGDIACWDLGTPKTKHQQVLGAEEGYDLIIFRIDMYGQPGKSPINFLSDWTHLDRREKSRNPELHGIAVHILLGPLRAVYLHQFWMEVIDYFFQGLLGPISSSRSPENTQPDSSFQVSMNPTTDSINTVTKEDDNEDHQETESHKSDNEASDGSEQFQAITQVLDNQTKSMPILMFLHAHRLTMDMPTEATAEANNGLRLTADFLHMTSHNEFLSTEDEWWKFENQLSVDVSCVRAFIQNQLAMPVDEHWNLHVNVIMPYNSQYSHKDVFVEANDFNLRMTHDQYTALQRILYRNISSPPIKLDSEIQFVDIVSSSEKLSSRENSNQIDCKRDEKQCPECTQSLSFLKWQRMCTLCEIKTCGTCMPCVAYDVRNRSHVSLCNQCFSMVNRVRISPIQRIRLLQQIDGVPYTYGDITQITTMNFKMSCRCLSLTLLTSESSKSNLNELESRQFEESPTHKQTLVTDSPSIATFMMEVATFELKTKEDCSMIMAFSSQTVVLHDGGSRCCAPLLRHTGSYEEIDVASSYAPQDQFQLQMKWPPVGAIGKVVYEAIFRNACLSLHLGAWLDIGAFLSFTEQPLENPIQDLNHIDSSNEFDLDIVIENTGDSAKMTNDILEAQVSNRKIVEQEICGTIVLADSIFVLSQDWKNLFSPCAVLEGTFQIELDARGFTRGHILSLQCFVSTTAKPYSIDRPVIHPITVLIQVSELHVQEFVESASEHSEGSVVAIELTEDLKLDLSYADAVLFWCLSEQTTKDMEQDRIFLLVSNEQDKQDNSLVECKSDPGNMAVERLSIRVRDSTKGNIDCEETKTQNKSEEFVRSESDDLFPTSASAPPDFIDLNSVREKKNGQLPNWLSSIVLRGGSIRLSLLDDCNGRDVPILRFEFSSTFNDQFWRIWKSNIGTQLQVGMKTNVDYFNRRVGQWEPFVETFSADLSLERMVDQTLIGYITVSQFLLINISTAGLQAINAALGSWVNKGWPPKSEGGEETEIGMSFSSSSLSSLSSDPKPGFAPFILYNQLSYQVFCRLRKATAPREIAIPPSAPQISSSILNSGTRLPTHTLSAPELPLEIVSDGSSTTLTDTMSTQNRLRSKTTMRMTRILPGRASSFSNPVLRSTADGEESMPLVVDIVLTETPGEEHSTEVEERNAFAALHPLPISHVGAYAVMHESLPVPILWSVKLNNGTLEATLSSLITFINHTHVPYRITIPSVYNSREEEFVGLVPFDGGVVSVTPSQSTSRYFRLYPDLDTIPCSNQAITLGSSDIDITVMSHILSGDNSPIFTRAVTMRSRNELVLGGRLTSPTFGHYRYNVHITSPIQICNLLPTTLSIYFNSNVPTRTANIMEYQVHPGKVVSVLHVNPTGQSSFSVRVTNHECSDWIQFGKFGTNTIILPHSMRRGMYLRLHCEQGYSETNASVGMDLSTQMSNGGLGGPTICQFRIIFWVSCVITDESGHNLTYAIPALQSAGSEHSSNSQLLLWTEQTADIVTEEIFENQRYGLFSWESPFLPSDRFGWSDDWGVEERRKGQISLLGEDWEWILDGPRDGWSIDLTGECEVEGWEYSKDFALFNGSNRRRRTHRPLDPVRRRRWTRRMKKRQDVRKIEQEMNIATLFGCKNRVCMFGTPSGIMALRVGDGSWSSLVDTNTVGVQGKISLSTSRWISSGAPGHLFEIGMSVEKAPNPFHRTRIVRFRNRFILRSKLSFGMELRVKQIDTPQEITIQPNEEKPYVWYDERKPKFVQIKIFQPEFESRVSWVWSEPFSIEEVGISSISLVYQSDHPMYIVERYHLMLLRLESVLKEATIEWIFQSDFETHPLYRLDNESGTDIAVRQEYTEMWYHIPANTSLPWARSSHKASSIVEVGVFHHGEPIHRQTRISLDRIGESQRIAIYNRRQSPTLSLTVCTDGPIRVLRVIDYERYKILQQADSKSSNTKRQIHPDKGSDGFLRFQFGLFLAGIGISFIDEAPSEIAYISLGRFSSTMERLRNEEKHDETARKEYGVRVEYARFDRVRAFQMQINAIQIDSHINNINKFPIVLKPVATSNEGDMFSISCVQTLKMSGNVAVTGLQHFRYLGLTLREFELRLDDAFLSAISCMITKVSSSTVNLNRSSTLSHSSSQASQTQWLCFDCFELHPIKCSLWFSRQIMTEKDVYVGINPLQILLSSGVTIDGAILQFNSFILQHALTTSDDLIMRIQTHLSNQAQDQILAMIGSSNVLGNPVGLVRNLGYGVTDFFYEPMDALIREPEQFFRGVQRGTSSLVNHTAFGLFNTVSLISGSIGSNVAHLSFDRKFIAKRAERIRNENPQNILEGMGYGGLHLFTSMASGVKGLVSKPIKGIQRKGLEGLVTGVGQGVTGLFIKPIVGVADFSTSILKGLKNTTNVESSQSRGQVRFRRVFRGPEQLLVPYDENEALIQDILQNIYGKKFAQDSVQNIFPTFENYFLVLTDKRILHLHISGNGLRCSWDIPWSSLNKVQYSGTLIELFGDGGTQASINVDERLYPNAIQRNTILASIYQTIQASQNLYSVK